MEKADKERVVAELTERLRRSQTLVVADYRGLGMTEIDALRTELLKHGARFSVVKNTLTRRAAEAAGADALLALLEGPTAIAFLESDGDPVAVAKALSEAARTTRILAIRGGLLDGAPMTEADVGDLAKLPPAEVLRGQVLGAILGPLNAIAALVAAPLQDLYGLIDARIEQLEQQGGGAQAEAAPVADADPATDEQPEAEASAPATAASGAPDAGDADGGEAPQAEFSAEQSEAQMDAERLSERDAEAGAEAPEETKPNTEEEEQ